jgi:hypothetical protein
MVFVQDATDNLWRDGKRRIWIPDDATALQVRIGVVGHFGIAGHRGISTTQTQIASQFHWANMNNDIGFLFGDACTARALREARRNLECLGKRCTLSIQTS